MYDYIREKKKKEERSEIMGGIAFVIIFPIFLYILAFIGLALAPTPPIDSLPYDHGESASDE